MADERLDARHCDRIVWGCQWRRILPNKGGMEFTRSKIRVARERYILEESAAIQQQAVDNVHW